MTTTSATSTTSTTPTTRTATTTPSRPSAKEHLMNVRALPLGRFGSPVGIGLAALGLLVIAFGWNGAASQLSVIAQVPYLLSGGMIGLSLVILGAAMIVVTGAREDRARLEAKLDALVEAVAAGQLSPADVPGQRRRAATPGTDDVVVGTASFHAPGCRLVAGREGNEHASRAEALDRDLKACRVCRPDSALAR